MDDKNTIIFTQFGSHIYGTNVETSDKDYKAVYLPTVKEILLQKVQGSINLTTKLNKTDKNTVDDVDTEYFSYQKFIHLLMEGQTVAIDMLFTPEKFHLHPTTEPWNLIVENKDKFLHSGVASFVGYCKQQANKYGIKGSRVKASRDVVEFFEEIAATKGIKTKLTDVWDDIEKFVVDKEHIAIIPPSLDASKFEKARMLEVCNKKVQEFSTVKEALNVYRRVFEEYGHRALLAEKNEGIDWKALMHAVRVCEQAKELLATRQVTFPRPEAELLLKIRKGEMQYKDVADIIEQGLEDLVIIKDKSSLPKKPDYKFAEELIYEVYKKQVMEFKDEQDKTS